MATATKVGATTFTTPSDREIMMTVVVTARPGPGAWPPPPRFPRSQLFWRRLSLDGAMAVPAFSPAAVRRLAICGGSVYHPR